MDKKLCWRTIAVCLVLGLGTVALYSPAFHFNFVNYDDQLYVVQNPHVNKGLTAAGVGWAFHAGYAANWHPLTWLSHMLDCQLFGLQPGWHHLTSILLHALNSVLVFLVFKRMTNTFWRSAAVAAFFAWHPLHVESVAWIAERKDVLSALFFLLALWAYVRYAEESKAGTSKTKRFYAGALVLFALGLMAKPMLVTLPCVLLLLDWWPLRRVAFAPQQTPPARPVIPPPAPAVSTPAPEQATLEMDVPPPPSPPVAAALPATPAPEKPPATKSIWFLLVEKVPFFCLSAISSFLTILAQHREGSSSAIARLPFKVRLITAEASYLRYLEKTIWPSGLGAMYPFLFHRAKLEILIIGLFLTAISIFALCLRKTRPFWMVGWFWFVIMVFPTTNLVAAGGQAMADRYMYLPSLGLFLLICWEAFDLAAPSDLGRKILATLAGVALGACCVATSMQLQIWRNDETLLSRIAMPDSNFTAYANYAAYLMNHNRLPEAEAACDKAVAIAPRNGVLYALLGNVLLLENKPDEAIAKLNFALKADSSLVDARFPLGRALALKKRLPEAAQQFAIVAQAEPRNFEALTWLGKILEVEGRPDQALAEFHASIKLQPNQPDALNDAAWILATDPHPQLRHGATAVILAKRACELTRNQQPVMIGTLAAAYAEVGQFKEAVATAQQAIDLATAQGKKNMAQANARLQARYRQGQPYHQEKQ